MQTRLSCFLVLLILLNGCAAWQGVKLIFAGDTINLLEIPEHAGTDPNTPDILLLAIDGVGRDLLYEMLRAGELPELASLLGGAGDNFAHAHFESGLLSTLPSSTGVAWATMMTGVQPAVHGVTGNEFFIRETGQFAAPVPVTVNKVDPVLRIYTEGYANKLLQAPTVYEQIRAREPGIHITVAMHQYYAGADELILADRSALAEAFETFISDETAGLLSNEQSLGVYRNIDEEVFENIIEIIDAGSTPDLLTIYIPGVDHFSHISDMGPDVARRLYLQEAIEPLIRNLREKLLEEGELDNRYVVISSDHGHTEVMHDDKHSLGTNGEHEPPALLKAGGYTPRPFTLEVAEETYFDTVLAYQGAMAFIYVADQSSCKATGMPCDWTYPARREDIDKVAELFYRNNHEGNHVPQMQGALDMILVRTALSKDAAHTVFQVYTGGGRSVPLDDYLAAHPQSNYIEVRQRLDNLSVGPHGDRAGDVILIANNGNRDKVEERYYFATLYHSWHGSPSVRDARVPLIVAHTGKNKKELSKLTGQILLPDHSLAAVTRLLLRLRFGE